MVMLPNLRSPTSPERGTVAVAVWSLAAPQSAGCGTMRRRRTRKALGARNGAVTSRRFIAWSVVVIYVVLITEAAFWRTRVRTVAFVYRAGASMVV